MVKSTVDKLAGGMEDAIAYAVGKLDGFVTHIPGEVDAKSIRKRMKLSQPAFAETFGFRVGRIRDRKQHRTLMSSRVLLNIIDGEPEAVRRALAKTGN